MKPNPNTARVLVFASYNESKNLEIILKKLSSNLTNEDAVIIADDSEPEEAIAIKSLIQEMNLGCAAEFLVSSSGAKGGRGAAVRRAFKLGLELYPAAKIFIESDSDGSHRPEDLVLLRDSANHDADLLIGSRYTTGSQIVGWSFLRRVLSRVLNWTIPKILGLNLSDVTNGLRRYSRNATIEMLTAEPRNSGFIYLSEVALLLSRKNFLIQEMPITFEDRIHGTSSVTWHELRSSLSGIFVLVGSRFRN